MTWGSNAIDLHNKLKNKVNVYGYDMALKVKYLNIRTELYMALQI